MKLNSVHNAALIDFPKSEDQADVWESLAQEVAEGQGRIDPK
tara:strand:- start:95 stop:220 length:126 start_codon:yes stop_codon:yes gene_type:complete